MFQSQLEGAKSLHLTDDKEVVVEEGVNDSAARTIERCLHLILRKVGDSDAREWRMMIRECHWVLSARRVGLCGRRQSGVVFFVHAPTIAKYCVRWVYGNL
jgi:hypothetical protein